MDNLFMISNCEQMLNIFSLIRKLAKVDYPILITGETGTCKELAARAIYEKSKRAKYQFVSINCSAIPEDLFESELFGYEKGAFTGAVSSKKGKVEIANKGILFLDEIGDLSLKIQPKFLRFLETSQFNRLGNNSTLSVDVRVIGATNKDIEKMVEEKTLREDLYHRLSTFRIHLPPLRDRGNDLSTLAHFFIKKFSKELDVKPKGFAIEAKESMLKYSWPGNIRELINKIRKAIVLSENHLISCSDMGLEYNQDTVKPLKESLYEYENKILLKAVQRYNGNISKIADMLCVSRPTIYQLLKKHGIETRNTKEMLPQEKRKTHRLRRTIKAVLMHEGKNIEGKILNLSSKGYHFISHHKLKNMKDLRCIVHLPDMKVSLKCTVAWERRIKKQLHLGLSL